MHSFVEGWKGNIGCELFANGGIVIILELEAMQPVEHREREDRCFAEAATAVVENDNRLDAFSVESGSDCLEIIIEEKTEIGREDGKTEDADVHHEEDAAVNEDTCKEQRTLQ